MTITQRMALATCSMLLAGAFFLLIAMLALAFRYNYRFALEMLPFLPFYLIVGFPGWISALPFVFLFKDAKVWRCWTILILGTILGPLVIFAWCMLSAGEVSWRTDGEPIAMSLCIGFLTASFYVALLRRFDRKAFITTSTEIYNP